MQSLGKGFVRWQASVVKPANRTMLGIVKRGLNTLYSVETCEDCVQTYRLPSVRKDLKRMVPPDPYINKDPCWQALRRTDYKCRTDPEFQLDAFIDKHKKCLRHSCAHSLPRLDLTHYKPSDTLNRKYARTWVKCVLRKRAVKAKCYFKPVSVPRRKRKRVMVMEKTTSTSEKKNSCRLDAPVLELKEKKDSLCPRIAMPHCKPSRVPPSCVERRRKPQKCQRRMTKYPAFSECLKDPLPPALPIECKCLETPSMCDLWTYYRNKKS